MNVLKRIVARLDETSSAVQNKDYHGKKTPEVKLIDKALKTVETKLGDDSRAKEYWILEPRKEIEWVTLQSEREDDPRTARAIAKHLREAGLSGWTVKVCARDYYAMEDTSPKAWSKAKV